MVTTNWGPFAAGCIGPGLSTRGVHAPGILRTLCHFTTCHTSRSPDGLVEECDTQRVMFCVAPKDTPPSPHSFFLPRPRIITSANRAASHRLRLDRHPFGPRYTSRQGRGSRPIFTSTSYLPLSHISFTRVNYSSPYLHAH